MAQLAGNSNLDSIDDVHILAMTLWGEARGEGVTGQTAVACVIMNRVAIGGWWGKDVRTVCLKPYQFSCWLEADPNRTKMLAVPDTDPIFAQCLSIARMAIAGTLTDITGGADSYERTGIGASWAVGLTPVRVIGHHSFYRTVKRPSSPHPQSP